MTVMRFTLTKEQRQKLAAALGRSKYETPEFKEIEVAFGSYLSHYSAMRRLSTEDRKREKEKDLEILKNLTCCLSSFEKLEFLSEKVLNRIYRNLGKANLKHESGSTSYATATKVSTSRASRRRSNLVVVRCGLSALDRFRANSKKLLDAVNYAEKRTTAQHRPKPGIREREKLVRDLFRIWEVERNTKKKHDSNNFNLFLKIFSEILGNKPYLESSRLISSFNRIKQDLHLRGANSEASDDDADLEFL
jgi:hypothetical protein